MTLAALPPLPGALRFVETRCAGCRHTDCTCPSIRVEKCACGCLISAVVGSERLAVSRHNLDATHAAWRLETNT
jgi:hypothetical protein